jgi:glycosyltransferase involved in cell wall biosynthesis
MKVLVVAPAVFDTSPGQRFRIEQWARYLPDVTFDHQPFEDEPLHHVLYQSGQVARKAALILTAYLRRLQLLTAVRNYDLVYLFREGAVAGPALFERLLGRSGAPVVFDFDDAVWIPYVSQTSGYLSYLKFFGKTSVLCRLARHVMVGNDYLAEYARRHNPNVSIIPTTIDTRLYQVRTQPVALGREPVTVGWTGSFSSVPYLDTIRPVLVRLRARVPFRLLVIGASEYRLDGIEVEARPWKADEETNQLRRFDIGVMPLPDDEWSRGKCGLKLLQCMGVGVPVVGSPIGVNRTIIREGENGYLAATEAEWVDRLERLIRDTEARWRMGLAGRRLVEECYSAEVWAPRVRSLFESVALKRERHASRSRIRHPVMSEP